MPQRFPIHLIAVALVSLLVIVTSAAGRPDRDAVLSAWGARLPAAIVQVPVAGLVGDAAPAPEVQQQSPPAAAPAAAPAEQLAAFNAGSALQESAAGGLVEFYRRAVGGGELIYAVARLDERVHVEVLNADNAVPTSDATGDTMWADGGRHLQPVAAMASAPFAAREGKELLWAMAFGFHGDVRTSNEGTVVINGTIHRVNAGRGALCITADNRAMIGKFNQEQLAACRQAVGGGPVILWDGKIANPDVGAPTDEYLPFNPLGEDFVQLDWRIMVYNGGYPKTAVCVGDQPDGRSFLVLANSNGVSGVDFARALRDMGCHSALGGDDDTSTQAVWRGQALWQREQRPVPDAIAVYAAP
jgi:hypothetical protein